MFNFYTCSIESLFSYLAVAPRLTAMFDRLHFAFAFHSTRSYASMMVLEFRFTSSLQIVSLSSRLSSQSKSLLSRPFF